MPVLRRLHARSRAFFTGKAGLWRAMAFGAAGLFLSAVPAAVHAGSCGLSDPAACIAMIFVWIFQILTALMGYILILEVGALIRVAQYFNFVSPGPTAVRIGWVVTRDLANMFFIVFLLIIAFSTVIGYAKYHYEKNLSRLLIMAVVINFSKTICGLFIDMSQVVMLSFVNGFKAAAAGNFLNAFQISKLLSMSGGNADYNFGLVLAMMLAFILAAIAVCVVLVMLVMLIFRVIMLWILIILSPIAFLTSAFPLSGNYYSQWWGELKKYLVGGPIIAFFLWLALATAQANGGNLANQSEGWGVDSTASSAEVAGQGAKLGVTNNAQIPSEAGRTDTIMSMIIAVCIMFAGLKFASDPSIGGMASGFAGKVRSKAQNALKSAATGSAKYAASPFLNTGGKVLAKVPLVGGLGRAAVLTSEKWKKERQAGREKFAGSLDDMARLSPGAFSREMNALAKKGNPDEIDKKRLDSMMGVALKSPKLAQELGKNGTGGFALGNMITSAKGGKPLQDALGVMMNDKTAAGWARQDPSLLRAAYDKTMQATFEHDKDGNMVLRDENGNVATADKGGKAVVTDPNMLKTLGELKQKFAPKLATMSKDPNDPNGEKIVGEKDLKEIVPRMSADDIGGILKKDMGVFMPHMTSSQFRKVMTDGKPDQLEGARDTLSAMTKERVAETLREKGANAADIPKDWYSDPKIASFVLGASKGDAAARAKIMADPERAKALQTTAVDELAEVRKGGDEDKIAAAAVQAISVGSLSADQIKGDANLRNILGRELDTSALARGIDKDNAGQVAAAREAFKAVMNTDPSRIRNLRANDQYSKLLPPREEIEAAVTANKGRERMSLAGEAPALLSDIDNQLKTLAREVGEDKLAGRPTAAKEQHIDQLTQTIQTLDAATKQRANAEQELAQMTQRLADAQGRGADASTISGLQSSLERMNKGLQDLDSSMAKQIAAYKGIKFEDGSGKGRKSGGGGRA